MDSNIFDIVNMIKSVGNNRTDEEIIKDKQMFKKKTYTIDEEKKIRKWLKWQFKEQQYNKWDYQIYMQVFGWSMNTKMAEDLQNIAMALTMGYMTYLASNNGKEKIPDYIMNESKKIYRETKLYNECIIDKKEKN
jgi:hypothetical protein